MLNGQLSRFGSPRRIAAIALFAAIVLLSIEWRLLAMPFVDRTPLARQLSMQADAGWYPDYPEFLAAVRARTADGDSIVIVAPPRRWDDGYAYAYYRASYFLPGREVLPVMDEHDVVHRENLQRARYIAAWRVNVPPSAGSVIWRGNGGVLVRR